MKKGEFTYEEILRAIYILDSLENLMFERVVELDKASNGSKVEYTPDFIEDFYGGCVNFVISNKYGDKSTISLTAKEIAMSDEEFDDYIKGIKKAEEERLRLLEVRRELEEKEKKKKSIGSI